MQTLDASRGGIVIEGNTATLLSKVLWITTAGFLFTALGAYIAPDVPGISFFFVFLLNLALIIGIQFVSRRSPGIALVMFYAFTVLMGIEIGPLLKAYLHMQGGQTVVFEAALTTALGMAVMAMIAQIARFDYMRVYSYAIAALFGLIIVGVIGAFVHFINPGLYAWATLAIFAVLLLVDFMRLRDGGRGATAVQLALSIYLDAINIFLALLQIFGGGSRRRS